MIFAYPSDLFEHNKVYESYEDEYNLINQHFKTLFVKDNIDDMKTQYVQEPVIYRGWMLTAIDYSKLASKILYEDGSSALYTDVDMYLSSHHLPCWYNHIKNLTPKSFITTVENVEKTFNESKLNKVFIKDYVKSLKTKPGNIASNIKEVQEIIQAMLLYRGHIEGGIVLREVHNFCSDTEKRFFVLENNIFSSDENIKEEELNLIKQVISNIPYRKFFSVDLIRDTNNKLYVVEIGDGQVSDYVGWDLTKFINIFTDTFKYKNKITLK